MEAEQKCEEVPGEEAGSEPSMRSASWEALQQQGTEILVKGQNFSLKIQAIQFLYLMLRLEHCYRSA